jgi:hypothetical protein
LRSSMTDSSPGSPQGSCVALARLDHRGGESPPRRADHRGLRRSVRMLFDSLNEGNAGASSSVDECSRSPGITDLENAVSVADEQRAAECVNTGPFRGELAGIAPSRMKAVTFIKSVDTARLLDRENKSFGDRSDLICRHGVVSRAGSIGSASGHEFAPALGVAGRAPGASNGRGAHDAVSEASQAGRSTKSASAALRRSSSRSRALVTSAAKTPSSLRGDRASSVTDL